MCAHTHTHKCKHTHKTVCLQTYYTNKEHTYTKVRMHACSWPSDSMVKNLPKSGTPDKRAPRLFLKPFLLHFFWNFSCYTFSETFPVSVTFSETFPTTLFSETLPFTLFLKPFQLHFFSNLSCYTFSETFPFTISCKWTSGRFLINLMKVKYLNYFVFFLFLQSTSLWGFYSKHDASIHYSISFAHTQTPKLSMNNIGQRKWPNKVSL